MHELSLAMSLVDEVEEILRKEGAAKVLSVSVSIGTLSGVEREPFEFCFPLAIENTALAGATLEITEVAAEIKCRECDTFTEPEVPFFICGKCGSSQVEIIKGREFMITSLEVK